MIEKRSQQQYSNKSNKQGSNTGVVVVDSGECGGGGLVSAVSDDDSIPGIDRSGLG